MAVLQGFTYNGSLPKFNRDQGCWPLYRRWPLLRGDRYEGFHCIMQNYYIKKIYKNLEIRLVSQCDNYCSQAQSTCSDFRLHHTCSIIILWLHSLSDVIRSLLCNPRASSPAIINIRISVPFMRDTTRACARKYRKDAGLLPSSTHVRQ